VTLDFSSRSGEDRKTELARELRKAGRKGIRPRGSLTCFNVSRSQFSRGTKMDSDEFTLKEAEKSVEIYFLNPDCKNICVSVLIPKK